jgi:hypothetical protein
MKHVKQPFLIGPNASSSLLLLQSVDKGSLGVPTQVDSSFLGAEPFESFPDEICSFNQLQPCYTMVNENVQDVKEHLIRWLALHRERFRDYGQDLDAQNLAPERIEAYAARLQSPFAWTLAAITSLEFMYYRAMCLPGDDEDGQRYILAFKAKSTLRLWTDYALQHQLRVAYSMERKSEAETSAQLFYDAMKQAGVKSTAFQKMCQQSTLVEEKLREKFHLAPPRTYPTLPKATTGERSFLSPRASPFCPEKLSSRGNSHKAEGKPSTFGQRLDEYFDDLLINGPTQRTYSEEEIERISELLGMVEKGAWRKSPRLYIVLRRLGLVKLHETLTVDRKITDASLPVSSLDLTDIMDGEQQLAFLQMQNCILTQDSAAMKCENGGHAHFANNDQIPFRLDGILGTGGFAQVEKVTSKITERAFARKVLHRRGLVKFHGNLDHFDNELRILRKLRHKHVVQIVGSYTEPHFVAMIMSPVAECDLFKFMRDRPATEGFFSVLRTFPGCLATALEYLHHEGIRHKDIKPSNILVDGCTVLFTDFGISRDCDNTSDAATSGNPGVCTPRYSAPEVTEHGKRSFPSDLWSLGCVFLEIFTLIQGIPLSDMNSYFVNNGTKSKVYCQNQKAISGWICHLQHAQVDEENDEGPTQWINQLLHSDSAKRPTAQTLANQIANHVSVTGRTGEFCGICCRYGHCEVDDAG